MPCDITEHINPDQNMKASNTNLNLYIKNTD